MRIDYKFKKYDYVNCSVVSDLTVQAIIIRMVELGANVDIDNKFFYKGYKWIVWDGDTIECFYACDFILKEKYNRVKWEDIQNSKSNDHEEEPKEVCIGDLIKKTQSLAVESDVNLTIKSDGSSLISGKKGMTIDITSLDANQIDKSVSFLMSCDGLPEKILDGLILKG